MCTVVSRSNSRIRSDTARCCEDEGWWGEKENCQLVSIRVRCEGRRSYARTLHSTQITPSSAHARTHASRVRFSSDHPRQDFLPHSGVFVGNLLSVDSLGSTQMRVVRSHLHTHARALLISHHVHLSVSYGDFYEMHYTSSMVSGKPSVALVSHTLWPYILYMCI